MTSTKHETFPEAPLADMSPTDAEAPARRPRRRFGTFGLRTLLVVAILFCLFFAWIGRGLYRVRQEDAAIEAILQMEDGRIGLIDMDGWAEREDLFGPKGQPLVESLLRAAGAAKRPAIEQASLHQYDPTSPAARRALDSLAALPEIEVLQLSGTAYDDSAIPALERLPNLKRLTLFDTAITGEGLAKFQAPESLETLEIRRHPYEAQILAGVTKLKGVRSLRAYDLEIGRRDVEAIASMPRLTHLDLRPAGPTDQAALVPLAGHEGIVTLELHAKWLDHGEAQAIADLPNLETLILLGAADADLPTLAQAPRLRTLELGYPASRDAAKRLSAERPDLTVAWGQTPNWPLETFRGGESDPEATRP